MNDFVEVSKNGAVVFGEIHVGNGRQNRADLRLIVVE